MTVTVKNDDLGRIAVVSGEWTAEDAHVIRDLGIRRLHGSVRGPDLGFLAELDGIDEVRVVDHVLRSDAGVMALPDLRALSLETYSQDRIDFRVFPLLERLAFNWRSGGETAFACESLKSIRVSRYPFTDLTPLYALLRLEGLRIASSRKLRSLDGLAALAALRVLSLRDERELADIGALVAMDHSLTEFELNVCRKVTDLSPLAVHRDLRRVMVIDCGRIASLAPLADLPALEEFWFYGTTVIEDGDMTPLLRMPALQRVSFAPRRHYSHRTEDIEQLRGLTESEPLPHWRW